ncbi:MAG: hypothetical protein GY820_10635 [Gammaproteobacteria bacterium]|nr:hypothetical protein [Gammaproteobacteria bacterium]
MPVEIFFFLLIGGLTLMLVGLLTLIYKLYSINTGQGAVAELNPELGIMFGLLNWKYTKLPIIMISCGALMVMALFWV